MFPAESTATNVGAKLLILFEYCIVILLADGAVVDIGVVSEGDLYQFNSVKSLSASVTLAEISTLVESVLLILQVRLLMTGGTPFGIVIDIIILFV